MSYRLIILSLMIFLPHLKLLSEKGISSPTPPVLKQVTVNHTETSANLTWTASPSPDIKGYVVYRYRNNEGYAIDTLWSASILTYTDFSTGALFFSEAYVVAAIDNDDNISPLSNSVGTIFLDGSLDTCDVKIRLSWNAYSPGNSTITGYEVLAAMGSSDFASIHTGSPENLSFEWSEFEFASEYRFMIRALVADGSVSLSNYTTLTTSLQKPPSWIETDNVSANQITGIDLSVSYDSSSEVNRFDIMRKRLTDAEYLNIASVISVGGKLLFTDTTAFSTEQYSYRVDAVNNCGKTVISTLPTRNIVLVSAISNGYADLSWNSYSGWTGGFHSYVLYAQTGEIFEEIAQPWSTDTEYTSDYKNFMYDLEGAKLCFYIKAIRYAVDNQLYEAKSNISCIETTEPVFVPTIFTPDDNGMNDTFRPVLPFTPASYKLLVRERNGRTIFETSNFMQAWDGRFMGEKMPPDIYLWYLNISTPSGKRIEMTGTIALIYNN